MFFTVPRAATVAFILAVYQHSACNSHMMLFVWVSWQWVLLAICMITVKFRKEFRTACCCCSQPPRGTHAKTEYIYRYRYPASPGASTRPGARHDVMTQQVSHIDVTGGAVGAGGHRSYSPNNRLHLQQHKNVDVTNKQNVQMFGLKNGRGHSRLLSPVSCPALNGGVKRSHNSAMGYCQEMAELTSSSGSDSRHEAKMAASHRKDMNCF